MLPALGQILRFLGLMIELLGILGLAFRSDVDKSGTPLPGSFSPRLVWGVIALGFVIWMLGTVLNMASRSNRPTTASRKSPLDLEL